MIRLLLVLHFSHSYHSIHARKEEFNQLEAPVLVAAPISTRSSARFAATVGWSSAWNSFQVSYDQQIYYPFFMQYLSLLTKFWPYCWRRNHDRWLPGLYPWWAGPDGSCWLPRQPHSSSTGAAAWPPSRKQVQPPPPLLQLPPSTRASTRWTQTTPDPKPSAQCLGHHSAARCRLLAKSTSPKRRSAHFLTEQLLTRTTWRIEENWEVERPVCSRGRPNLGLRGCTEEKRRSCLWWLRRLAEMWVWEAARSGAGGYHLGIQWAPSRPWLPLARPVSYLLGLQRFSEETFLVAKREISYIAGKKLILSRPNSPFCFLIRNWIWYGTRFTIKKFMNSAVDSTI